MERHNPIRKNYVSFQPAIALGTAKQTARPAPAGTGRWLFGPRWIPGDSTESEDTSGGGPLGAAAKVVEFSSGGWPLGAVAETPGWTSGGGALGAAARVAEWSSGGGPSGRKDVGLGYLPDLPDFRDKGASHLSDQIRALAGASSFLVGSKTELPGRVNLGDQGKMPAIEDQGKLNSCTANAVIGLVEYLIKASGTDDLDMSRLFLYWTTRRLLGWTGDTGAYIRTTIKAMALFGVPLESDWPYLAELLDRDPDAYLYACAQNFKCLKYARLDEYGMRGNDTLLAVQKTIADGFPIVFGFPVYRSIETMGADFIIPLPGGGQDKLVGGHAVLAVGYDDDIRCQNQEEPGALIIRNSWGPAWGDMGYGYLPYDYVRKEMALDFWAIFHQDWINLKQFEP